MSVVGSILTNTGALEALNTLAQTSTSLATAGAQISTGLAISSPADSPAGYIMAQGFESELGGEGQALSNANEGISLAQAAQGGMQQQLSILQNLYTVAVQAANGTETSAERQSLQSVSNELIGSINQIAANTQFNGQNLLDGTFQQKQFQTGADAGQALSLSLQSTAAQNLGVAGNGFYYSQVDPNGKFATQANPNAALTGGPGLGSLLQVAPYTAGSFKIDGYKGSATVTNTKSDAASTLAQAINAVSGSTGVQASAVTKFTIKLGSSGHGTYSLGLGADTGTTTGSFQGGFLNINNVSGASFVNQINSHTGATGISASMNSSGLVTIIQSSGLNVLLRNGSNVDTASGQSLSSIGSSTFHMVTYTGQLSLKSSEKFSLTNAQNIGLLDPSTNGAQYLSSLNLSTQTGAQNAMGVIQAAIEQVEAQGAQIGAFQDRLQSTANNLQVSNTEGTSALSVVQDANIPQQTNVLSEDEIKAQTGVAAFKQSSALQQSYISLLP